MTKVLVKENTKNATDEHYRIGQWFKDISTGNIYVLAAIGNYKVIMISPTTGHLWDNPLQIYDYGHISHKDLYSHVNDSFELIDSVEITIK